MAQTLFITGSSSGIGKVTAAHFAEKGWNVVATMRNTDNGTELAALDNVLVTRLDVTDLDSIDSAVAAGLERFGSIDALVNNAGYGAAGPLEAIPRESIVRQFDTNIIGLLDTTKAVIPHFRAQGSGVIVNISSVGGRVTYPFFSLYHGTKWAVEGLSEALSFEMGAIGVKVKIVEPGLIATDFGGRSLDFSNDESLAEYQEMIGTVLAGFGSREASQPIVVAEVIYEAVTDGTDKLRYPAGEDAHATMAQRAATDDETFVAGIKARFGL